MVLLADTGHCFDSRKWKIVAHSLTHDGMVFVGSGSGDSLFLYVHSGQGVKVDNGW